MEAVRRLFGAGVGLVAVGGLVFCAGAESFADRLSPEHLEAVNRRRTFVYNTDGCDMVYYQTNCQVNVDAFVGQRLGFVRETKVSTVSYCPLASGFGYFSVPDVGDWMTTTIDDPESEYCRTHYNAARAFAAIGHDALEMALAFCRERKFEGFLSIRMNDSHDGSSRPHEGKYHWMFSPFRRDHPEFLMGNPAKDEWPQQCAWQWTCVDYGQAAVRDYVRKFVRQFCEKYDMEGIEFDFCRHPKFFKRCSYGGVATDEERAQMTELVCDLRKIALEYEAKKGHPILLNARVPDSFDYCRDIGLDIEAWLKAGALDGIIGGCYFNLNDWKTTCDRVHALGAKFYASIDESRIPGACRRWNRPFIPGRDSPENYRASYAQAMKAGCDGIYLFNLEHQRLVERTQVDPRDTDGCDKIYFATQRGKGGYEPIHYLKDGYKYKNLPYIDPAADPETVLKDQSGMHDPGCDIANQYVVDRARTFEIRLADDFGRAAEKGKKPVVTVLAQVEGVTKPGSLAFALNGARLEATSFERGLYTFENVPPERVVCGLNAVEVKPVDAGRYVLNDFAVKIAYVPSPAKVRVACIGDSITYGYEMTNRVEECYPAQLQRMLGDGYEVRNFGDPGAGVYLHTKQRDRPRAWRLRDEYGPALAFRPDIVVCNLGINDTGSYMGEFVHGEDGRPTVERGLFRRQYVDLLESFAKDGRRPRFIIWTKLGPTGRNHGLNGKPNAFVMEGDLELVARDVGAEALDMYAPLVPLVETPHFNKDGIHPEGGAQKVIAEITAMQILQPGAAAGGNPVEHVAIRVPDPSATADWWVENLGFKVTRKRAGGSTFIADRAGKFALEVYGPDKDHPAPDYWKDDILQLHFGFSSADVDADVKRLVAAGAKLLVHNVTPGFEEAVLRDPWGLVVQFVKREKSILER